MAAPRPVDIMPELRHGPSAADVAGRVANADPRAQAQAQARIHQAHVKQQMAAQAEAHGNAQQKAAAKQAQKVSGFATVKSVLSADCLLLLGSGPANQPAPEKQITLSGITAPRPARRKGQEDEAFAWQSREFLRKMVIGKRVKFSITHVHESSGREYGVIEYEGEDLASKIVAAGWATVKMPTRTGKDSKVPADREALVELGDKAKEAGLGIYQDEKKKLKSKRKIDRVANNARAFFEKSKDKVLNGVVDQVREGSALRIEVPSTNGKGELCHEVFMLNLAGVQCPRIPIPHSIRLANYERQKQENPKANIERPKEEKPEPYAVDALQFTENRLLNRDVSVRVLGCDKLNNLFGTVHVPQGDISLLLARNGLARVVGWSAALTSNKEELEAEEQSAKQQRLRIWRSYTGAELANESVNSYTAKVVQVVSGDVLLVADNNKKESKVYLSSIRAPRQGFRDRKGEPWALEGREWLRKRLVGRKVRVLVDYRRSAPAEARDREERVYVSIQMGKENICASYVAQGYATIVRHRLDEDRSQFYDDLLSAESKALSEKKGVHNPKPPTSNEIVDLTGKVRVPEKGDPAKIEELTKKARETAIRARQFLPFLQKERRVKAVVEYVFGGSRLKVFVPSQNIMISFVLGGVRCPLSRGDTVEEYAQEALEYTRSKTLQHNVEIEVETLDKGDNFLGSLFVDRKNLSVMLLDRGLAHVVPYSAEKSPHAEEMFTAEALAQKQRLRVWKNWTEQQQQQQKQEYAPKPREETPKQVQKLLVRISEAFDPLNFFMQVEDDAASSALQAAIDEVASKPAPIGAFEGKRGDMCIAKYNDGKWYRCRVERRDWDFDTYEVFFVDFGNRDQMPASALRALPANALKQQPLARPAVLSGVRLARDYYEECSDAFLSLLWDRRFVAHVDTVDTSHKMHVTLVEADSDEKEPESVNVKLLKAGLVRIPSRPNRALRKYCDKLRSYQQQAMDSFAGMWEYGDVSSDEEEEEERR